MWECYRLIEIAHWLFSDFFFVEEVALLQRHGSRRRARWRCRRGLEAVPQRFVLRVSHDGLDERVGFHLELGEPHLQLLVAPDQLDRLERDVEQTLGVVRVVRNVLVVVVQRVVRLVRPRGRKYWVHRGHATVLAETIVVEVRYAEGRAAGRGDAKGTIRRCLNGAWAVGLTGIRCCCPAVKNRSSDRPSN